MHFTELFEYASTSGTFVGVRFHPDTVAQFTALQNEHRIPNPLNPESLHTTVVYSRVNVPWQVSSDLDETATPRGWQVWDTRDGNRCLVLELDSDYLTQRWQEARDAGATYDFPDYRPHVTLSYNVGDFDVSNLPLPSFPIRISHEYQQPLNQNWGG